MARIDCRGLRIRLSGKGKGAPDFEMRGLDLEIRDGEVMVVLGPSGCGKSTLLRLIAGLIHPEAGEVLYDGKPMSDVGPSERKIGMVFQDYALYPNMDNRTNVLSYFLFRKRTPELDREAEEKYRRTAELLGVDLEKLMDRRPKGLSGGERQRVAIGRCITRDPRLFLLDEPFSSLDQKLREKYRVQLRLLLKQFAITTVYVTHDQVEALLLADRIALMNVGGIEQVGTAQEIYDRPRSVFAAEFLNFEPEAPAINLVDGAAFSAALAGSRIGVRPEDVVLGPAQGAPSAAGRIVDVKRIPLRGATIASIRVGEQIVCARSRSEASPAEGSSVTVSLPRYHRFDPSTGRLVESVGY